MPEAMGRSEQSERESGTPHHCCWPPQMNEWGEAVLLLVAAKLFGFSLWPWPPSQPCPFAAICLGGYLTEKASKIIQKPMPCQPFWGTLQKMLATRDLEAGRQHPESTTEECSPPIFGARPCPQGRHIRFTHWRFGSHQKLSVCWHGINWTFGNLKM